MADILKITSPIVPRDNVHNLQKQIPTEGVFDLTNPNVIVKSPPSTELTQKNPFEHAPTLSQLNKELLGPLLKSTDLLLDSMRKIILMISNANIASGNIPKEFLDKLFVSPDAMLRALLLQEKNETAFSGTLFDTLRLLAKLDNQPKLQNAISLVLKYFDCFINKENGLAAILHQGKNLPGLLFKGDRAVIEELGNRLDFLVETKSDIQKDIVKFLKNDYIPALRQIVRKYGQDETIRNTVMAIINNIVRVDKGDPERLEEAITNLNDELKMLTNLSEKDLSGLKSQLLQGAQKIKAEEGGNDLASLLMKALDRSESPVLNKAAQNLLTYMVQNESPVLPIMHFMMPIDFYGERTYGEFFIDKNCEERKGEAKEARNIFFTIQSDKYGTFEVDLLAKDQFVELSIRCPEKLIDTVRNIKATLREKVEGQGYRLGGYQVSAWQEGQSILQKFPKFAIRRAGVNVKA